MLLTSAATPLTLLVQRARPPSRTETFAHIQQTQAGLLDRSSSGLNVEYLPFAAPSIARVFPPTLTRRPTLPLLGVTCGSVFPRHAPTLLPTHGDPLWPVTLDDAMRAGADAASPRLDSVCGGPATATWGGGGVRRNNQGRSCTRALRLTLRGAPFPSQPNRAIDQEPCRPEWERSSNEESPRCGG